jgi:hypothetical protein
MSSVTLASRVRRVMLGPGSGRAGDDEGVLWMELEITLRVIGATHQLVVDTRRI